MLNEIISHPLFGILLTVLCYELAVQLYKKVKFVLFTPFVVATVLVIAFLLITGIDYETYNIGGQIITMFISPITIVLAVPLYLQIHVLKENGPIIITGIFVGCITALFTMIGFAYLFGMDNVLFASLLPKSITTAIAVEVCASLGGIQALTVLAVMIAGLTGAILAPVLSKVFRIRNEVAVGLAIGTSAHALGTSKAVELGETQAAMSSLSIGIAGIITVILAPFVAKLFM